MTETQSDWADTAEQRLLDAAIPLAAELGWSGGLLAKAGAAAGLSPGETDLLTPNGARDLAALFSRRQDQAALTALAEVDPASLKIRDRIRRGVLARLDAAVAEVETTRRWAAFLALPANAALGLRLAWESADVLWRWAGDTATDENHYSKRAILAGVLISTLTIRLGSGAAEASAFLDRRIDNVMRFEQWKAGIKTAGLAEGIAGALGRLRYGRG